MCTTQDLVARLLRVADETHPSAVGRDFDAAFGTELQRRGTYVLVSVQKPQRNDPIPGVRGMVMLGDIAHPLNFGDPQVCVTLELLELPRIPDTTSLLGTYEATLDADGNLLDARRLRRYPRNQYDPVQQGEDS